MSPAARNYLAQILDIMQANSVNRKTIDWPRFRQTVVGVDSNEQTIQDLYPKIRAALLLLSDHHSFYQGPDSFFISNPSPPASCREPTPPALQAPGDIGYVKVGSFSGRGPAETAFAQGIQDAVRAVDRADLAGWNSGPAQQRRREHVAHGCRRRANPRRREGWWFHRP